MPAGKVTTVRRRSLHCLSSPLLAPRVPGAHRPVQLNYLTVKLVMLVCSAPTMDREPRRLALFASPVTPALRPPLASESSPALRVLIPIRRPSSMMYPTALLALMVSSALKARTLFTIL